MSAKRAASGALVSRVVSRAVLSVRDVAIACRCKSWRRATDHGAGAFLSRCEIQPNVRCQGEGIYRVNMLVVDVPEMMPVESTFRYSIAR